MESSDTETESDNFVLQTSIGPLESRAGRLGEDCLYPFPKDADFWFLGWIVVAYILGVIIHELGHVVAGKMAGLRIAACGIGFGRCYLHFRIGGITYYVAQRPISGLVTPICESLTPQRFRSAICSFGGPFANLLLAAAAFGAWNLGFKYSLIAAEFHTSLWLFAGSLMPARDRRMTSDGQAIFGLLTGRDPPLASAVDRLRFHRSYRDFYVSMDCVDAAFQETCLSVLCCLELDLLQAAQRELAHPVMSDPRRHIGLERLEAVARAGAACCGNRADACEKLELARELCRDDNVALDFLAIVEVHSDWQRTFAVCEALAKQRTGSWQVSLRAFAELYHFLCSPPEDVATACQSLIDSYGDSLNGNARLELLSETARILVVRGDVARARHFFVRASRIIATSIRRLEDPCEREELLLQSSKILRAALAANTTEIPLWIEP